MVEGNVCMCWCHKRGKQSTLWDIRYWFHFPCKCGLSTSHINEDGTIDLELWKYVTGNHPENAAIGRK